MIVNQADDRPGDFAWFVAGPSLRELLVRLLRNSSYGTHSLVADYVAEFGANARRRSLQPDNQWLDVELPGDKSLEVGIGARSPLVSDCATADGSRYAALFEWEEGGFLLQIDSDISGEDVETTCQILLADWHVEAKRKQS